MKKNPFITFAAGLLAFTLAACSDDASLTAGKPGQIRYPIVNGVEESGFPAIGALIEYDWTRNRNQGQFCSSTLIRPNWVLTAAHCFGGEPDPGDIAFLTGEIAVGNSSSSYQTNPELPEGSQVYKVKRYIIHPRYDPDYSGAVDIALVELEAPVLGIEPMPLFTGNVRSHIGELSKSVGYGYTGASEVTTASRKRSTDLRIMDAFDVEYYAQGENTGVCYGDSGGPNLINIDGQWQVAGVHEYVMTVDTYTNIDGSDSCLAPVGLLNVEALRTWIYEQMGEPFDCHQTPDLCHCPEACQADGSCELYRCGGSYHCGDIDSIEPETLNDVILTHLIAIDLNIESINLYNRYLDCYYEHMYDEGWFGYCKDQYLECQTDGLEAGSGTAGCTDTIACLKACDGSDTLCISNCLSLANGELSIWSYRAYLCSYYNQCDDDLEGDCMKRHCRTEVDACNSTLPEPDAGLIEDASILPEDASVTHDAGPTALEDASIAHDAGPTSLEDASVAHDASLDEDEEDADEKDDSGCSSIPGSGSSAWLSLLVTLCFLRRRRS